MAGSGGDGEANDAAAGKDEGGAGVFLEKFALAGIVGAGASGENGGFVGHGSAGERGAGTRSGRATCGVVVYCGNQNASPSCARVTREAQPAVEQPAETVDTTAQPRLASQRDGTGAIVQTYRVAWGERGTEGRAPVDREGRWFDTLAVRR